MAAEAQKVVQARDKTPGTPEVSMAQLTAVVDDILRILEHLPPAYRVQALRMAESKIRPSITKDSEVVRKVTKASRGSYLIALPASFSEYMGTYKAYIENGRLILEPDSTADARIRLYGGRLRLMLPKRLVEALGFPSYVRVRVEDDRIIIEPA